MLECVPNFSEGRNAKTVEAIATAIRTTPGVALLGYEMDSDHNRSVFTFAGEDSAVVEAAVRAAAVGTKLIDLSKHEGIHPRVGVADVVPFVPLDGSTMADAVAGAHRAGKDLWQRAGVPVYFYGWAAQRDSRRRLELVRRAGFDGFPPDVGDIPSHGTAGASVVGAREFLLAFNVDLKTKDVRVANEIARKIRASSGGFPHVKAIGLYLESRQRAQVSMNLTKFAAIPLEDLYHAIASASPVADCEVIGFVPQAAYDQDPAFFTRASNFNKSRILETVISQMTGRDLLK